MPSVIIRRAGPEHGADIRRLLAVQLAEHGIGIGVDELRKAIDGVIDVPKRGFFLVALRDDACIGVAYVSFIWALEHGGHAGWLEELYVVPEHRQGGVGTRLLEAICTNFRRRGVRKVRTMLARDNTLILSFFRSQGMTAGSLMPLEMDLEA